MNKKKTKFAVFKRNFIRDWQLHLMIVLPTIPFVIFRYGPMYGVQIAFRNYRVADGITGSEWVGFKWFIDFLTDPRFGEIFINTIALAAYSLLLFPIPVIMALIFNAMKSKKYVKTVQTISYMPHFISTAVFVGIIDMLLSPVVGIYGNIFRLFGGDGYPFDFRTSAEAFRHIHVWSGTWKDTGWATILYTSALSAVPMELHEAARIDGASRFKRMLVKGAGRERSIALPDYVDYTLSESNALLLDMAEYALDSGEWHPKEELLRLDVECRKMLGWSTDIAHVAQPWSLGEESEFHRVTLKFRIESAIEYEGAHLAIEKAEDVNLRWNGREVDNKVVGWYVDKAIKTVALPKIEKGENLLEAEVPIGKRTMIEWMYLLGDFGVEVLGKNARIIAKRDKLTFGDVTVQGLSFYTGNITYHIPIETEGGHLRIHSGFYVGAMQEASIDGKEALPMIYPPYTVSLGKVEAGKHMIDLTFYGTRQNGFGALHLADEKRPYLNPSSWRTEGDHWCYEYMLSRMGVLATPEIVEEK